MAFSMAGFVTAGLLSFGFAWLYAYIVYWLDRFEREPKRLLLVVFLWGALVATIAAAIAELILGAGVASFTGSESFGEMATHTFFAPFFEESLKGIAVFLVFIAFYSEFDSILDGLVYAGIVALGFAATENTFYLFSGYDEAGWAGLVGLFFLRIVLTGWNHPMFTAFIGIGLAVARLNRTRPIRLIAPFVGWLIAIALHSIFNTFLTVQEGALALLAFCVSWIGWLLIMVIVIWAIRLDRSRVKKFLSDEVERGTITAEQFRTASSALAPTGARLRALGSGHYRKTRRFFQVSGELAQKKAQLDEFGEERGNRAAVESLRAELAALSPQVQT